MLEMHEVEWSFPHCITVVITCCFREFMMLFQFSILIHQPFWDPPLIYDMMVKIKNEFFEKRRENIWAALCQNQQNDCAPSEDSDQSGHPPWLIRVIAVRMKKAWTLSYPLSVQRGLWSDWADAQADLSLRWAHIHFVCFVMRRLI